MNPKLTMEKMKELWYKYYPVFDAEVKIELLFSPKSSVPYLFMDEGTDTYTDMKKINIGLGSVQQYNVSTEEEFVFTVLYLIDHECGHIKHTPKKPWEYGFDEGIRQICRILSETVEGPGKRIFRKPSDIDKFVEFLNGQGISLSVGSLKQYVHFIQNALEDGREERLQAKDSTVFRNRMRVCRGKNWMNAPVTFADVMAGSLNPTAKLLVKLNQILSLATTSLYQKDFFEYYNNSSVYDEIEQLVPYITKAVTSGTCRKCMQQALEIERMLADDLINACKSSSLDKVMSEIADNLSDNASYNSQSTDELNGIGEDLDSPGVFDENGQLEKSKSEKDSNQSSDVLSNEDSDDDISEGTSNNISENTSSQNNTQNDNGGKSNTNSDSSGNPEEIDGKNDIADTDKSEPEQDITGEFTNSEDSSEDMEYKQPSSGCVWNHKENNKGVTNEDAYGMDVMNHDKVTEAVEKAMMDAAAQSAGLIGELMSKVNSKPELKEKKYINKPVTPIESIKEKYSPNMKFYENIRKYELRYQLPSDIQYRADSLRDEIEQVLQNEKRYLYGLNSGKLNASAVSKFILGDVDLYYRDGEPKTFDGVVYQLIDNSGSMGYGRGSKREYSLETCAIMESAFNDLMPLKITAFDAQGTNHVTHECIKDFDEVQDLNCSYNFLMQGRGGNGNKDGYSIRIATQELLARKEEDKLLLIISDGLPSDYPTMLNGREDVKNAVEEARACGIKVIPIFQAESENEAGNESTLSLYKEMYGDIIATVSENIETEILKIVKDFYLN